MEDVMGHPLGYIQMRIMQHGPSKKERLLSSDQPACGSLELKKAQQPFA